MNDDVLIGYSRFSASQYASANYSFRAPADAVNTLRSPDRSFVVITHYQRILNYIIPDYVHVMSDGQVVKSGGKELALELEEKGYDWIRQPAAAAR